MGDGKSSKMREELDETDLMVVVVRFFGGKRGLEIAGKEGSVDGLRRGFEAVEEYGRSRRPVSLWLVWTSPESPGAWPIAQTGSTQFGTNSCAGFGGIESQTLSPTRRPTTLRPFLWCSTPLHHLRVDFHPPSLFLNMMRC